MEGKLNKGWINESSICDNKTLGAKEKFLACFSFTKPDEFFLSFFPNVKMPFKMQIFFSMCTNSITRIEY